MKVSTTLDLILNHPTGIDGVNYNQFVLGLFRPMEQAAMFTHAALGVVSEYHEATTATDHTNFIEELGDYLFFTVAMLQQLPEGTKEAAFMDVYEEAVRLIKGAAKEMPIEGDELGAAEAAQAILTPVLDVAKRWMAYDKEPSLEQATDVVVRALVGLGLVRCNGADIASLGSLPSAMHAIISANVAKLRHRYKAGFSTEAAIHRDLDGEADALRCAQ